MCINMSALTQAHSHTGTQSRSTDTAPALTQLQHAPGTHPAATKALSSRLASQSDKRGGGGGEGRYLIEAESCSIHRVSELLEETQS